MNRFFWLALCLLPGTALAQDTVIYRCASGDGVPTLQRTPCPAGSQQRILTVPDTAPRAAAPAADTAAAATAAPPPAPPRAGEERTIMEARMVEHEGGDAILDSALLPRAQPAVDADADAAAALPLPPIFQCQGADGGRYLHEREPAPPRCVALAISGLGGGATPVNAASCEVVRDTCTEVPAEQACGTWQQRFRDARGRERFATPDNQAAAQAERQRLQGVLQASHCPVPQ
ncbi:hypothetical protein [Stenotrophomonas sp. 24(2023)]|uniref:hypothetical protein n=1 Tax=Stenotrophomonas sp. 24(2023) TaxID=3068324 RepID=UPI0027E0FC89|nr:hypothetical protein [Stenotrophomonas sp. 24(2023)]WMJ70664.1 hypothetical protein Q9R17_06070 [Stenotrophomonas sp. 24(2023)]